MNVWTLPSSRRFVAQVADRIAAQQCCIVILPEGMNSKEFIEAFDRHPDLAKYGLCTYTEAEPDEHFAQSIRQNFDIEQSTPINFDELLSTSVGSSFLVIRIPSANCAAVQTMGESLRQIAKIVKRKKDAGDLVAWTLLVVTPAALPLPESDVSMDIMCWQGKWRKADVETAFDECIRHSPPADDTLGWWLYALCLGIGTTDPTICLELFRETPRDMESLVDFLRRHPAAARTTQAYKNSIIALDQQSQHPPGPIRYYSPMVGAEKQALWGLGLLDLNESGELVIHPAALVSANRLSSLERMVCQGQQQVFLPLVHSVLRYLHTKIFKECGNDWHKKGQGDTWETLEYDIGPLPKYLKEFLRHCCPANIQDAAVAWREVRHTVAHNTFLPFGRLHKAMGTLKRI
jgi:hypothetical protein